MISITQAGQYYQIFLAQGLGTLYPLTLFIILLTAFERYGYCYRVNLRSKVCFVCRFHLVTDSLSVL